MNKLFGPKPKGTTSTMNDAIAQLEGRTKEVEKKILKCDEDLKKYKEQLNRMREGTSKNMVKQRAMMVVKQKRMLEQQLSTLHAQVFNLSQVNIARENLKDSKSTVEAMQLGMKELKKEYKQVNPTDLEDLQDDMHEALELADAVQDSLGRSYGAPEMDDDDLEAELAELDQDADLEDDSSYLDVLNAPVAPSTLPDLENAATGGRRKPALSTH